MNRISNSTHQSPSIALLESLSESRISILYLARQAKEGENTALAKKLTDQGQSLRQEMSRIRRTVTPEWNKETKMLISRAGTAQAQLAKLVEEAGKSAKKIAIFTRALGVVSNILSLARKVL